MKPAPVAEPEAAEETVPTEVEIKKPARRGRKSVIPELPKQMEPVAPQEIVEEAALAPRLDAAASRSFQRWWRSRPRRKRPAASASL